MPQKLVTIYLRDAAGSEETGVMEHLQEYLEAGWTVVDMKTLSGPGAGITSTVAGWIVVLLEYEDDLDDDGLEEGLD